MIRIARPPAAPAALQAGVPLVEAMHQAVHDRPNVAGTRAEAFTFDSGIYGHETVKTALKAMQHQKCAFCEGKFAAFCYGDVEHYRPKAYSQQRRRGPTIRPGYYWLAYEWTNLLVSCEPCNRKRKGNVFPLRNPAQRARTPAEVATEEPLIIDPSGPTDPQDHIRFNANVPEAVTRAGEVTVDLLALDRVDLNGDRAEHLSRVEMLAKVVEVGMRPGAAEDVAALAAEAAAELDALCEPAAEFSAMTRDFLGR